MAIESRITLRGDVQDVINKMNILKRNVNNISNGMQSGFQRTNQIVGRLSGLLAGIGAGVGFMKIIQTTGEFENAMQRVRVTAQASTEEFNELKAKAQEMGATTQYSATQAAEALQLLAQAGLNTKQSIQALPTTLDLAAAGAISLADSADILTNVTAGMNYSVGQSSRVADVLAQTARNSNTSISLLGETAKVASPVFAGLGLSVEELAIAAGVMANNGIKGAEAGTALAGAMSRLLRQPEMVSQALADLGVTITEQSLRTDGFMGTLNRLKDAGISMTQMTQIFGEHWKSVGAIMNTDSQIIENLRGKIDSAKGAAHDMGVNGIGAWKRGMDELSSTVEGLMIKLGEGGLLKFFNKIVSNITSLVSSISNMSGGFESAIPIIYAFGTAITVLYASLTGGVSAIITAVAAVAVGITAYWNEIIDGIQNGINATIDFINQYTALRVAVMTVYEYVKFLWEYFKSQLNFIWSLLKTISELIVNLFKALWNGVKSIFTDDEFDFTGALKDSFSNAFSSIMDEARQTGEYLSEQLTKGIESVTNSVDTKLKHVSLQHLKSKKSGSKASTEDSGMIQRDVEKIQVADFQLDDDDLTNLDLTIEKTQDLKYTNEELANSYATLGRTMSSAFRLSSDSLLGWAANTMAQIPQIISAVQTLGLATRAESTKNLVASQAEATGNAVKGASLMPWPASIPAILTAVATIAGIFMSLPKFETGGIVGGSSYSGDNIIARLNSGEGVLTRRGISNLSGLYGGGVNGGGEVTFRIRDNELIGLLSKSKSRNKSYR